MRREEKIAKKTRLVARYIKLAEWELAEGLDARPAHLIAEWEYRSIDESIKRRELAVKIAQLYLTLATIPLKGQPDTFEISTASDRAKSYLENKGQGQRLDVMKGTLQRLQKRLARTY